MKRILTFEEIGSGNIAEAGGKNASLGELIRLFKGSDITIPMGFAITSDCFREFILENRISEKLKSALDAVDPKTLSNLSEAGATCRQLIREASMPMAIRQSIEDAYKALGGTDKNISVAVRSSATAEDLPAASFAGQHDSFLNIMGTEQVVASVQKCYESLFNDRAIKYRIDNGFSHQQVFLSVGIQHMVRSDLGSAGVIFTIDPETGFERAIYITGAFGLGENVVQGNVSPDAFWVFKPTLAAGKQPIIGRRKGRKEKTMIFDSAGTGKSIKNTDTPLEKQKEWILTDREVITLAVWSKKIEDHYRCPMDIEWAKDGITHKLFILQARPETVHSQRGNGLFTTYTLKEKGELICRGISVGKQIISGRACIIESLEQRQKLQPGDILIADTTNPDWNTLLRRAVCIVTNKGGRTSHASIVARELGIPALVGTGNATEVIADGDMITVVNTSGEEGLAYRGSLVYEKKTIDFSTAPYTKTEPLLILADPDKAFELSAYPSQGVGLLRMEFIISNSIRIHPMALVDYESLLDNDIKKSIGSLTADFGDKSQYFIQTLSDAIAKVAAAFYPNQVIVRFSDFKTNEYASLLGGAIFEPAEENPMIGFRGASRYYDKKYSRGFALECRAVKRVRDDMGFTNVKVMIPFCRTLKEAEQVISEMDKADLKRGENGLQVYMMVEIPSNVILADRFAKLVDGFSIGSNDLTQLILGIDRDSEIISGIFDENNDAVLIMIAKAIKAAKKAGIPIGLCGQAPSDFPEFSRFLVKQGIDTISFTPDSLMKGIENIAKAEQELSVKTKVMEAT